MSAGKERLDVLLVERGLCDSREQGKRLVLAGEVLVGGHPAAKPGMTVSTEAEIRVKAKPRYVSRGGLKLEGALETFGIDPAGRVCLDIGSSTGGFTDCLLQGGASKVYAFDVGTNQLAWKLRSDPRVISREQFNARHLSRDDLPERVSLVVVDVSFISLTLILPRAFEVLAPEGGEVVCLIKPQFELAREEVGKGGIVRAPGLPEKAVAKIEHFVETELAQDWAGVMESPVTGTDGNREFLAWLKRKDGDGTE